MHTKLSDRKATSALNEHGAARYCANLVPLCCVPSESVSESLVCIGVEASSILKPLKKGIDIHVL